MSFRDSWPDDPGSDELNGSFVDFHLSHSPDHTTFSGVVEENLAYGSYDKAQVLGINDSDFPGYLEAGQEFLQPGNDGYTCYNNQQASLDGTVPPPDNVGGFPSGIHGHVQQGQAFAEDLADAERLDPSRASDPSELSHDFYSTDLI